MAYSYIRDNMQRELKLMILHVEVFGKLPTYPSPMLTLTLTSHLGQNDGLGEG